MKKLCTLIVLVVSFQSQAQITLDSTTVTPTVIVQDLDTPWEILYGPDNHIWFTERYGRISRVDPESPTVEVLTELPDVFEVSESGMLGMTLHPDFMNPDSQFVYVAYTYFTGVELIEKVVRLTFDTDTLINQITILDSIPAANNHNGSRLMITDDRKLVVSTGDAQVTSLSQDSSSLAGKFLRMNLDGSIPSDNPIPGSYIWTTGHRNAQGLVKASNGIIYSSEHGPANDDEINIIDGQRNYGWPDVEGYCDPGPEAVFCASHNVTEPIIAWTPTLAVAGLDYYDHTAIPEWSNALLLTSLKEDDFRVLRLNATGDSIISEDIYFNNDYGRLRDLCVAPNGDIFISTSNRDGRANGGFPIAQDDRIIRLRNESFVTGISESESESFSVYPNPATDQLIIKVVDNTSWQICNVLGNSSTTGTGATQVDISGLTPGIYFVRTNESSVKFVKE